MLMLLKWWKWHLTPCSLTIGLVVAGTVASLAEPAGAATVTVEPGQNLTEIANRYGVSVETLAAANGLTNPNRVLAGQTLVVPGVKSPAPDAAGQVVVVEPGENLTEIAERYDVTVEALAAANGITDPNRVLAGSHLTILGGGEGSGMQLASYNVPATDDELPAQLLADPGRLALEPDFVKAADAYGVPVALLEAMCWWESGWQEDIVSTTGAIGVCQIEPSTAAYVDADLADAPLEPTVTSQNIELGAALLGSLLRTTDGNVGQALAGYYQGLDSVQQRGMLPTTATYVRGVEAYAIIFSSAG